MLGCKKLGNGVSVDAMQKRQLNCETEMFGELLDRPMAAKCQKSTLLTSVCTHRHSPCQSY
ncbi:hypothetical protein KQS06HV_90004 [Klebsiella quasipneumoniae subsp. similipneumoniae]|nr:hypothetical protein KQS06HV_90004 [Klebsiella quasipneumoniae subsp. similipneumoniae]